jgi:hypothetical protein
MQLSTASAAAKLAAFTALLDGGTIEIYTGASPGITNAATGTKLGTLSFSATAFGTPTSVAGTNSVATANAITGDTSADADGTAGYFRCKASDGTTVHLEGNCGTNPATATMVFASLSIVATQPIDVISFTLTEPVA